MPTIAEFVRHLEAFAPPATAADWDNVGLLLGDPADPADRVMTCLTVTPDVVAEAVAENVQLIVAHHPILFRGAKKLSAVTPEGRLLRPLLRTGVAVYSPHTAFDNCEGGINDGLCRRLGVTKDVRPLRPRKSVTGTKLAVFVPDEALGRVMDALFAAGAGNIGEYEQCSFRTPGTGTFFGKDAANPAVGQKGRREEVSEQRLEVIIPPGKEAVVVTAMRSVHPYEEPAFDVYPLHPVTLKDAAVGGDGRIGDLEKPVTLAELADTAKAALDSRILQVLGDPAKPVRRVAVACGAAGEFLSDAVRGKADVFVTGELRFHDVLTAEAAGVGLLLPGHYASERPGVEDLARRLAAAFPAAAVWASRHEREPLRAG